MRICGISLLALSMVAGSIPAYAQQAAQRVTMPAPATGGRIASATKLVGLLKMEGVLDTMFQQITPLVTNSILASAEKAPTSPVALKSRLADPKLRPDVERIMSEEVLKGYRAHYAEVMAAAARQYAAMFSEADLQAAIGFYQSPAGEHFIAAQPELQAVMSQEGRTIGSAAGKTAIPAALTRIESLPAPAQ